MSATWIWITIVLQGARERWRIFQRVSFLFFILNIWSTARINLWTVVSYDWYLSEIYKIALKQKEVLLKMLLRMILETPSIKAWVHIEKQLLKNFTIYLYHLSSFHNHKKINKLVLPREGILSLDLWNPCRTSKGGAGATLSN